jgi:Icc-related predicted phosphoesterase
MIRRLLMFSGVHGNADCLSWLTRVVQARCPDALLFAGGILPLCRASNGDTSPWGLNREARRFIEDFFATLGKLGVFTAVIPALAGESLEELVRPAMQAELRYPHVHVVHATLVQENGLVVCGLGAVLAEERLLGIDCCSRPVAEYFLRPLWTAQAPRKVLLLPKPPPGKLGGAQGDPLVADLLDSFHPDLCVVAGSSALRGSARYGHTLVVNPGCLAEGWAAWLDWSRQGAEEVEMLHLRPPGLRKWLISREELQRRAYFRWEKAGRPQGDPTRFWLEAESEARAEADTYAAQGA